MGVCGICLPFPQCLDFPPGAFQCSLADSNNIKSRGIDTAFRAAAKRAGVLADTYDTACFFIHVSINRCQDLVPYLIKLFTNRVPVVVAAEEGVAAVVPIFATKKEKGMAVHLGIRTWFSEACGDCFHLRVPLLCTSFKFPLPEACCAVKS